MSKLHEHPSLECLHERLVDLLDRRTATFTTFQFPAAKLGELDQLAGWARESFSQSARILMTCGGQEDVPCVKLDATTVLKPMLGDYDITIDGIDPRKQMWNTLVVDKDSLELAREKIPGFRKVTRAVKHELQRVTGLQLALYDCHLLHQLAGETECASTWGGHMDTHDAEDESAEWRANEKKEGRFPTDDEVEEQQQELSDMIASVVLLLADTNPDGPSSGMKVVGFEVADYGTKAGGAVAFPSHAKHQSVRPQKGTGDVYKLACFFRLVQAPEPPEEPAGATHDAPKSEVAMPMNELYIDQDSPANKRRQAGLRPGDHVTVEMRSNVERGTVDPIRASVEEVDHEHGDVGLRIDESDKRVWCNIGKIGHGAVQAAIDAANAPERASGARPKKHTTVKRASKSATPSPRRELNDDGTYADGGDDDNVPEGDSDDEYVEGGEAKDDEDDEDDEEDEDEEEVLAKRAKAAKLAKAAKAAKAANAAKSKKVEKPKATKVMSGHVATEYDICMSPMKTLEQLKDELKSHVYANLEKKAYVVAKNAGDKDGMRQLLGSAAGKAVKAMEPPDLEHWSLFDLADDEWEKFMDHVDKNWHMRHVPSGARTQRSLINARRTRHKTKSKKSKRLEGEEEQLVHLKRQKQ